ncbi:MAG: hypothetical protein CMJ28_04455 [Phycisphaerae bacterium]|nr:hypothetical protein [Phycisphaerae bacterium]
MSKAVIHPVLVVGDLMLDEALFGCRDRVCPDAPAPVFQVNRREASLGGAARVAAVLSDLGVAVRVVGVVGSDAGGEELLGLLQQRGISTDGIVVDPIRPTTIKRSHFEGAHTRSNAKVFRVDIESGDDLSRELRAQVERFIHEARESASLVVVSDYGKGVVDTAVVSACQGEIEVLVDPSRHAPSNRYVGVDVITPNREEAIHFAGRPARDSGQLARAISDQLGVKRTVVTLDVEGAVLAGPEGVVAFPAEAVCVIDVAGAGDAFIAGMAAQRSRGDSWSNCIRFANQVAAERISKKSPGVAVELKPDLSGKISDRLVLPNHLQQWRAQGRRVILTNGCFDLLHAGHVSLLTEAARLGDVLVVGLNTDASVRELKGPNRPVRSWEDRSALLAALECVDVVVPLAERTAHELIREIHPDLYVKGGDYKRKDLVEIDLLDELKIPVHLTSVVPGASTTAIAQRLRSQA